MPKGGDLRVDLRVVDDLAEDEQPLALEFLALARGVGEVDGAFHPVAKAELLGQPHRQPGRRQDAALRADALDEFAAVVGFHLRLDGGHDVGRAQVDALARFGRGGKLRGVGRRAGHGKEVGWHGTNSTETPGERVETRPSGAR